MILPSDADYRAARKIKRGLAAPRQALRPLIEAVSQAYDVIVLDAMYDRIRWSSRPRLTIVLERERDAEKFLDEAGSYDVEKQARVKAIFDKVQKPRFFFGRYETNDLHVVFESFEQVARIEAVDHLTPKQLETWKAGLGDPNVWLVRTLFASATVFYQMEAQAKAAEAAGAAEVFSEGFAELVKPYDEFGYLADNPAPIYIDSKENFETNYQGNWFYYDR